MVAILSKDEQRHFLGLLQAMGNGDGRAAARHVLQFSSEQPNADPQGFEDEMQLLFERTCRGYGTAPDFGKVVQGVLAAVRNHRVRINPNYMTLIINAMCLDAMARKLQPTYNVLDASKPLLQLHERIPRALFSLCLPFARLAKARIDARHFKRLPNFGRRG
jgi:predicted unusual protein kinase regulating ubiquinone biosynthesis (AarF/ABC1/UbiB family)